MFLESFELHGVTNRETVIFIGTGTRTSNPRMTQEEIRLHEKFHGTLHQ
jgi:hypothetical protein